MSIELRIPDVGESVREVQIGRWLKKQGDSVDQDEDVVQLETDKASLELPAPEAGVLVKILKQEGETVAVGEVIGYLETDGKVPREEPTSGEKTAAPNEPLSPAPAKTEPSQKELATSDQDAAASTAEAFATPAARRALRDHGLSAGDIHARGPRIDQTDVLRFVEKPRQQHADSADAEHQRTEVETGMESQPVDGPLEEVMPMSLIRRRTAERLVEAQRQAALLTTFNEIDMSAVNNLRAAYREPFREKYGVKLGFMSFFVKAVIDALHEQPALNAEIRGEQIVYRNYYHIGVAIASTKGLVVPVLQFAERLSFAQIERTIDDFAQRAGENKLKPQELAGGTFTITNGGVFGSLFSTPIVNPPQSGVLGMHAIQDRPVALQGQVVIRPMMYVALTYDHRLVDGRQAVTFLRRIKETIEDPARMLLEV